MKNTVKTSKEKIKAAKSQPVDEPEEGEEMVDDETTTEDMPLEDVDSLFMERM